MSIAPTLISSFGSQGCGPRDVQRRETGDSARDTGHYFGNSFVHLKLLQSKKGLKSDRSGNFYTIDSLEYKVLLWAVPRVVTGP